MAHTPVGTPAIRNLIRGGRTRRIRNVTATGHRDGMQTLETGLDALAAAGTVAHQEAVRHTAHTIPAHRPRPSAPWAGPNPL